MWRGGKNDVGGQCVKMQTIPAIFISGELNSISGYCISSIIELQFIFKPLLGQKLLQAGMHLFLVL